VPDTDDPTTDELRGRLTALADQADDFDQPGDPYPAIRRRGAAVRRHRALAVTAALVLVTGTLLTVGGTLHGAGGGLPAGPRPSPTATLQKVSSWPNEQQLAAAPALPAGGVGTGWYTYSACDSATCPSYLFAKRPGADSLTFYRLPVQPGAGRQLSQESLSPDGRWLWYHHDGRTVLRDLTTGTEHGVPAEEGLLGWQTGKLGTPIRWALLQDQHTTVVDRVDLRTGHRQPRDLAPYGDGTVLALGVLASGDLVVGARDGDTGAMWVSTVDPATNVVRHRVRVPGAIRTGGAARTARVSLDPDGRHAVFALPPADGSPTGWSQVRIVDLATGSAWSADLNTVITTEPKKVPWGAASWTTRGYVCALGFSHFGAAFYAVRTGPRDLVYDVFFTFDSSTRQVTVVDAGAVGPQPSQWVFPGLVDGA
jgi:hypothetical protein